MVIYGLRDVREAGSDFDHLNAMRYFAILMLTTNTRNVSFTRHLQGLGSTIIDQKSLGLVFKIHRPSVIFCRFFLLFASGHTSHTPFRVIISRAFLALCYLGISDSTS